MTRSIVENIDCMTRMREAPDNHWDLAICDPPYGIGYDTALSKTSWSKGRNDYLDKTWDNKIPPDEYFTELKRVSVDQIIWGGQFFGLLSTRCWLIWFKSEHFTSSDFEMAWTSFDEPNRAFKYARIMAHRGGKIHPTQKPVALYKWLLTNYAKQGDTILDTHLGSGSSRIAAYDLGFDFTGFELDFDYWSAQEERFARHIAQAKLFDAPVLETVYEACPEQAELFQ